VTTPLPQRIGPVGVWTFALDQQPAARAQELAAELEELGYGAIWIPEAVGRDALVSAELLLAGTTSISVATGIASIYARDPIAMKAGWCTVSESHPDRFVLGLGVSHRPMVEGMRGHTYAPPIQAMSDYLDAMDAAPYLAAPPPSPPQRVLAALGPRMLELARDKSEGAHPYLVPPEHTARAREILGPDRLLAPDQKVVLDTDPERARAVARQTLQIYLGLPNYTNNLRRLGFTDDDLDGGGSDRLADAIIAWGSVDEVAARVRAHHDAGADHVCVQVQPITDIEQVMRDYRTLADALTP
jgi:probable F420-dependent oxidoreductase